MELDMKVTFKEDEILEMVREKLAGISTPLAGNFDVHFEPGAYCRDIVAEFEPAE